MTATTAKRHAASRYQLFDQEHRDRATATGRPLERLAMPAALYPATPSLDVEAAQPSYILITRRAGKLYARDMLDGQAEPELVDFDALATAVLPTRTREVGNRWLTSAGGVLFTPDEATARDLTRRATAAHAALGRALELAGSLPASTRLVVLPKALASKFFLPGGYDETDLADWARAFGLPRSVASARVLTRMLYQGAGGTDEPVLPVSQPVTMPKVAREMATRESSLLRYAGSGSLSSDCGRFDSVVAITSRWEFMTQTDRIGRLRAMLDGTVFRLTKVGKDAYRIGGAFKVRDGKEILMLPAAGSPGAVEAKDSMRVLSISVGADDEFVMSVRGEGAAIAEHFAYEPSALFIQAPFLPSFGGRAGRRWTAAAGSADAVKPKWRDVPLHVSLAGAPRDAPLRRGA